MHCPTCDALNHDLSRLRQEEAEAILERHYAVPGPVRIQLDQREEMILQNRQSQAEIAFTLERHLRDDHHFMLEPQ